jgi:hypothetical protein
MGPVEIFEIAIGVGAAWFVCPGCFKSSAQSLTVIRQGWLWRADHIRLIKINSLRRPVQSWG